ncbi:aminoacyl-tRNA deacylase [Thiococcus pfennigii]|jgi:Ala-tRNA(Pro) deacylase|uniref:aminoacyl-tRNA deacylase n=1 Tax=Thiococcus pfennigii TaxID=1057 RepID=UPI0019069535|nr:YbaK/EbsC family protein [Thiococcus pfennigii]MBK1730550.1 hypothetical protein [Thiococcus pfennigii]
MTIATSVETYLNGQGVGYELVAHKATGSTHETATAAHVPEDHMAKAVILRDQDGHAMAVIPGTAWLHLERLNQAAGRDFALVEESDLDALFPDCARGAVPPLGPAYGVETFLDEDLTSLHDVYFEAGDHQHLVHVDGEAFQGLLKGARRGRFSGAT